jgi:hypothetical protein
MNPPDIPYRSASPPVRWTRVATYASAGQWHAANRVLSHQGISARMATAPGDAIGYDLLVIETEAEWARDLLGRDKNLLAPPQTPTYGFPVCPPADTPTDPITSSQTPASAASEPAAALRPIPAVPVRRGLSDRQQAAYTAWIIVLCLLAGLLILLMGLLAIFTSRF